jgi:hypothetical protein
MFDEKVGKCGTIDESHRLLLANFAIVIVDDATSLFPTAPCG